MMLTRRSFLKTAFTATAVLTTGKKRLAFSNNPERPNILYIMADDHAVNAISSYGSRFTSVMQTPNIDRLANEGARLDHCFCTNSICVPSRATIMTGQYSHINHVYTLRDSLDPGGPSVAKELQKAGYQTALFGKWHLHSDPAGFDEWKVLPGQGRYHNPVFREKEGQEIEYEGHSTDIITQFTLDWLGNRNTGKPFFLMCHFKAPA